jgi:hypothetical protein
LFLFSGSSSPAKTNGTTVRTSHHFQHNENDYNPHPSIKGKITARANEGLLAFFPTSLLGLLSCRKDNLKWKRC